LYFADAKLPLYDKENPPLTMAHFMGVEQIGYKQPVERSPDELAGMFYPTPWPGIRLLPAGGQIQLADMALVHMAPGGQVPIYRVLHDSIRRWENGNKPTIMPQDMRDSETGRFKDEVMEQALSETFDVIVIDQQPALQMTQLNGLIAADTAVIPQTLKGFDLATLSIYMGSIHDYLEEILDLDEEVGRLLGGHVILPSIVQESNDRDLKQIADLLQRAPDYISRVFYTRSDAVANASEKYMSIYEYMPSEGRKKSASSFALNANCVNDSLVRRALPELPGKGYMELFEDRYYGDGE
jgi:chromosome partitioning protein